jgi:hypothetical protein
MTRSEGDSPSRRGNSPESKKKIGPGKVRTWAPRVAVSLAVLSGGVSAYEATASAYSALTAGDTVQSQGITPPSPEALDEANQNKVQITDTVTRLLADNQFDAYQAFNADPVTNQHLDQAGEVFTQEERYNTAVSAERADQAVNAALWTGGALGSLGIVVFSARRPISRLLQRRAARSRRQEPPAE